MSATPTPGPWYLEKQDYDSSSYYIRGSDVNGKRLTWGKGAVARIPRSTLMPMEANARLIAAAPELLEALQLYRELFPNHENEAFIPQVQELEMKAKAAIAKALGEQA